MDFSESQNDVEVEPWRPVSSSLTKEQAKIRALVLDSRSITCCIESDKTGWQLLVPNHLFESAIRELTLYNEANQNWPPAIPQTRQLIRNSLSTVSVLLLLATFHNLTLLGISVPHRGLIDLKEMGVANAERIIDGEWWRCITALTLHADMAHLLGNLTIGGIFILLLCHELGSGLTWTMLLASGALGNLLNAWAQSPSHRSVGASTSIFAAVGILSAISAVRHRNQLQRRRLVPAAAGLALLAILGTEGKQTDLGAHLFGFGFGVLFGMAAEYLIAKYGRPGEILNFLLAVLSGVLVAAAWWAAMIPVLTGFR